MPADFALRDFSLANCRNLEPLTVIIIDQRHARGVDFRAMDNFGLDLLVAAGVANQRSLIQLGGRVGRYDQPCKRFILDGVSPIREAEERQNRTFISHRVDNYKRKAIIDGLQGREGAGGGLQPSIEGNVNSIKAINDGQ